MKEEGAPIAQIFKDAAHCHKAIDEFIDARLGC